MGLQRQVNGSTSGQAAGARPTSQALTALRASIHHGRSHLGIAETQMLRYPRGLRAKHVPRLTAVHRSKVARPNPGAQPGDQVPHRAGRRLLR